MVAATGIQVHGEESSDLKDRNSRWVLLDPIDGTIFAARFAVSCVLLGPAAWSSGGGGLDAIHRPTLYRRGRWSMIKNGVPPAAAG